MTEPSSLAKPPMGLKLFVSYSHKDKALRDELESHLASLKREGVLTLWSDRSIRAGQKWGEEIDRHLICSDVILLLVSPDFLASDYCYTKEMKQALALHESGQVLLIPIILRPVDWMNAPFAQLQALPTEGEPITLWPNRDLAMMAVAKELRIALEQFGRALVSRCLEQIESVTVVTLGGSLQQGSRVVETHRPIKLIRYVVERGGLKVLFDLHRVSEMDSSGIAALFGAYAEATKNNIAIAFCCPTARVSDLLYSSRLEAVFKTYSTRQAALAALECQVR
jgi:anti-anti-sigma factor